MVLLVVLILEFYCSCQKGMRHVLKTEVMWTFLVLCHMSRQLCATALQWSLQFKTLPFKTAILTLSHDTTPVF